MRRRWTLGLLLGAIIVAVIALRVGLRDSLDPRALVVVLRRSGSTATALPMFVAIYFVGTWLLIPSVVFHVASGAAWGFRFAVGLNFLLANLASNLQFWVGRRLGRERVKAWLLRRGWVAVVQELELNGALTMLVVRQLPLPFVGVNVAAGASPLTWRQFLVGSGLGLVPQVGVYTYFAASIADGLEGAQQNALSQALLAGACVVGLALVSRGLVWWRRRAQATRPT